MLFEIADIIDLEKKKNRILYILHVKQNKTLKDRYKNKD